MRPADYLVIDSDGHVIEPPTLWADYVEKRFVSRAPRPTLDENGGFCYVADDTLFMRTAAALGPDPDAAEKRRMRPGGWDSRARLEDMDVNSGCGFIANAA